MHVAVFEPGLAARLAGNVLRLQSEGAEGQKVVARHAGVDTAVFAAAATEVAFTLIEDRIAVEERRADAGGDFETGPVLERIDFQIALVSSTGGCPFALRNQMCPDKPPAGLC